jgi:TolB protein
MNALDGSNPTNLTKNSGWDIDPAYSPNGKKRSFSSDRRVNNEIHVMNSLDGSSQKRLTTNAASDEDPDWGVRSP